MKRIIAITTLLLASGCSILQNPVAKKEAEILKLMATIRPELRCPVGEPWFTFSYQRHDDLTLDALLNLYKTASDENVRHRAIDSLRRQNNPRLIPFWQDILDNRDKVDKQYVLIAISGLGAIHVPQSNRILLALLSDPEASPELLVQMLGRLGFEYQASGYMSKEILDQIVARTSHKYEKVRLAAFEAVPYHSEHSPVTEALRNELLGRALGDTNPEIVRWGLSSFGKNPPPELFPIMLDYLNHADSSVRALADEALSRNYLNGAENVEMCRKTFEEKRWTYQTAPLLASRYAQILEEERGEFAEAEKAYQTAQRAYASNGAYRSYNSDPGVTMLYRLIQVKQKRGDIEGAIAVLNQLVKEYPKHTGIYAHDFPTPGYSRTRTVRTLETELRTILEDTPIRIHVSPLNEPYHPKQRLKFKVSIHNITTENVMLHCKHRKGEDVLFPGRPIVVVNGNRGTDFYETAFLADTVKKVAIPPNESFAFIGTLHPLRTGNYVIDFRFKPVCEFEDGTQWSAQILTKSVKIKIP